jgi:hypothetical protein
MLAKARQPAKVMDIFHFYFTSFSASFSSHSCKSRESDSEADKSLPKISYFVSIKKSDYRDFVKNIDFVD